MTTKQWLLDNLKDYRKPVSASAMADGLGCEMKYLLRSKWRLRPRVSPFSKGASTGKYVHRLDEVGPDGVDTVREEVIREHGKLLKEIREGGDLTGSLLIKAKGIGETLDKAIAIAKIYWEKFPPKDYIKTICREETLEETITTELGELPTLNRLDRIDIDTRNGGVWLRDTKTTTQGFDSVLTGYLWCAQCRMYRVAATSWLKRSETEGAIRGFILDMIAVPGIKYCPNTKDAETKGGFNHYIQRVKEWYQTAETKAKAMGQSPETMTSMAIQFNEPLLNREFLQGLTRIHKMWLEDPVPEKFSRDLTRAHCFKYRKKCPYFDLCNSDVSAWPSLIEQSYEIREDQKKG